MLRQRQLGYGLIAMGVVFLIVLTLTKASIDRQNVFLCKAVEADPGLSMEECPAHQNRTSWLLMTLFGLAFVILAAGIAMLLPRTRPKPKKPKNLGGDEKKLYDIIAESDGSIYQSDLVKQSGFSKVKVTRVLDRLEQKDVAERKRRGMTNLVVLK